MAAAPQLDIAAPHTYTDSARIGTLPEEVSPAQTAALLERARARAAGLDFPGNVTPDEAVELIVAGVARLIDVRTPEERKFVGYVPHSIAVPWATGTAFTRNPHFIRELERKASRNDILLFLCRSGSRSILAAEEATRAHFQHSYNVLEGFEGALDQEHRRGTNDGWRLRGLPWIQD
jgi:rhodanese-related sulfurtransferase